MAGAARTKPLPAPHREPAVSPGAVNQAQWNGLDADVWQHLTDTFTCGSSDTKAELDEIIARSRELWRAGRESWETRLEAVSDAAVVVVSMIAP